MDAAASKSSRGRRLSAIVWVGGPDQPHVSTLSCDIEPTASEASSTGMFSAILWVEALDGLWDVAASDGPVLAADVDSNALAGVTDAAIASRRSRRLRSFSPG